MNRTIVVLTAAALLSGCALVESYRPGGVRRESTNGGSESVPLTSGAARQDQRICTVERTTGSYMVRRVCRTQEQIEAERESANEMMREAGTRPGTSPDEL